MRERVQQKTLGDYVTIAFSPLLIMALVGSLVFFLLEVLYAGQYSSRLQWTLFWFVFAMVLIARIAIEQQDGRAGMYGIGLGIAVFLALQAYIEYPPGAPIASFRWAVNLSLMALIWWCAHRLVWDCTYIDEKVDDSGAGILDAAGLDSEEPSAEEREEETDEQKSPNKKSKKAPEGFSGWLDRYRLYREHQEKKPHTPGVWVVYFSLAALPLFGLGQALIPATAGDRRRYAFWLMVIYVGSGLGLLLTTSFLGLRRYLRQRKIKRPVSMTAMWLAMGGGLIALMLLAGALLPRPYGEYQLIKINPLGSPKRDASNYSVLRDGEGKGEGRAGKESKGDAKAKSGSGNQRTKEGGGQAKGEKGDGSGKGKQSGGSSKGDKGGDKSGKGKSSDSKNRNDPNKDPDDRSEKSDEAEKNQERDSKGGNRKQGEKQGSRSSSQDKQDQQKQDGGDKQDEGAGQNQSSPPPNPLQFLEKLGWLGTLLKWIVFAVIALVVAFFVLRSGLRWLANFTLWARNLLNALSAWWQGLFGGSSTSGSGEADEEAEEPEKRPRPFSSYSNPFRDGTSSQVSAEEVARYSFAALEAWAYDHELGRAHQETPIEFVERVSDAAPALASDGKRMVACFVRVAYARSRLAPAALEALEKYWDTLESAELPDVAAKATLDEENGT
jgi:hypothetical protein